jgi:hypothetical protein
MNLRYIYGVPGIQGLRFFIQINNICLQISGILFLPVIGAAESFLILVSLQ